MFAPSIERSAEKVFTSGFHSSHFWERNEDVTLFGKIPNVNLISWWTFTSYSLVFFLCKINSFNKIKKDERYRHKCTDVVLSCKVLISKWVNKIQEGPEVAEAEEQREGSQVHAVRGLLCEFLANAWSWTSWSLWCSPPLQAPPLLSSWWASLQTWLY